MFAIECCLHFGLAERNPGSLMSLKKGSVVPAMCTRAVVQFEKTPTSGCALRYVSASAQWICGSSRRCPASCQGEVFRAFEASIHRKH